ncbi:MAG: lysophospholipid acyltransferase family protein [Proteobacteria bacterium]|nr:lysophospholipid acyltransferase family protein [Pseudomonadota bacterium]MBU1740584.1 lysophospholipid acyltransferase family protein [Pseudomonadota bacterium]
MDRSLYRLMIGLSRVAGLLPLAVLRITGRIIGDVLFWIDRRHRSIARRNLRFAYGDDLTEAQVHRLAQGCYRHLGQMALELLWLMCVTPERLSRQVRVHGLENVYQARRAGRGIILLGAHAGNWELAVLVAGRVLGRVMWVVRPLDPRPLDRLMTDLRTRWGNDLTRTRQGSRRSLVNELGSGGNVGILLDQDAHWHESVLAPFFGRSSRTNQGLALIWLATHSPVVPCFSFFQHGRWHVVFGEPLPLERFPDTKKTIEAACRNTNAAIEAAIRRHPEQWLWQHHRWRIYYD